MIVANPTNPIELSLTLDEDKEGDQVVRSEGGRKYYLYSPT